MSLVGPSRRFLHSVWNTRPRQLYHRARLLALRRFRERRGPSDGRADSRPTLSPELPRPVFPPRTGCVRREGGLVELDVLGLSLRWTENLAWRHEDPEWTQLRHFHLEYMEWLEELSDEECGASILGWIAHHTPYEAGYWYAGWSSYVLSLRTVVWLQQLATRPSLGDEVRSAGAASIVEQLRVLADHLELDVEGNHLVKNAKALLWAARCYEGDEAREWGDRGSALLRNVLDDQILADGMHYERSPAYHGQVLEDLLECHHVLEPGALRDRVASILPGMAAALATLTHPDGCVSLFNDGGLHMSRPVAQTLGAAGGFGVPTDREGPFALADAGFYGHRCGADLFVLRCGAIAPDHLPAHGHADILSFEWTVDGQRIVVDAGVSQYEDGEPRRWSRSTRAHNTVTLDDEDQCEVYGSFRLGRRSRGRVLAYEPSPRGFVLEGEHDGFRRLPGRPIHRRRFEVQPDHVHVVDEVRGGAGQTAVARLLLHPEVVVEPGASGLRFRRGRVVIALQFDGDLEVVPARWMPDQGVEHPTQQVEIRYPTAPTSSGFQLSVEARSEPSSMVRPSSAD